MNANEIREGDIVEIDYIAEFTKEHINEGKALVIWKGFNSQPLVRKLSTKNTVWTAYEHIAKIIGHIDIEGYMDKALEQEPKTDGDYISREDALLALTGIDLDKKSVEKLIALFIHRIKDLPSVNPQEPKTDKALILLAEWANECGFGYDNIPDQYEKYKDDISGMGYAEGLTYIAKMESEGRR